MADIHFNFNPHSRAAGVRKHLANLFLGLFVIAVGVGYLGNYLDVLPWTGFTLFFPGWGALFLIVPSIYFLIRRPFSWFWPILLLVGVLILISKLEIYPLGTAVAIVLAILVIMIGLRILLSPLFKRARRRRMRKKMGKMMGQNDIVFSEVTTGGTANGAYNVSFGDRTVDMSGQDFTSATLQVSFGEMRFDLTNAIITDCAVIDASCSFGELLIRLPADVRAEVSQSTAFAGIANRHPDPAISNAPVVYINANCSFGEITIQ